MTSDPLEQVFLKFEREIDRKQALRARVDAACVHPTLTRISHNNVDASLTGARWFVMIGYIWQPQRFKKGAADYISSARSVRFHREAGTWDVGMRKHMAGCIAVNLTKAGERRREAYRLLHSHLTEV